MAWTAEESDAFLDDLEAIADHLFRSHMSFGHGEADAAEASLARIHAIRERAWALIDTPHIGTRHDDIRPGLRHVTFDRAIYWFTLDEDRRILRLVGVFQGSQDHLGWMLKRLMAEGG
ncbi:type II toxin-antitoxin system RelE/ParE family toxin [Jannaschia formosa]|uniref:type II toxin-antitoxin system RelE/ParE family toxin n=1 Tax=Jannaschia formosa TaxID=2259592 RepID=UPI000E1B9E7C|nr:type II toxin-antitoxin system RelE/ParE family toxin [Jannaschia formosa]TFL17210.1 type II toxin-antitoxin system RelE/ParE family toxin [Jannaschia formosa]